MKLAVKNYIKIYTHKLFVTLNGKGQVYPFGNMEPETIEHLFVNCIYVNKMGLYVIPEWLSLTGSYHVPGLSIYVLGVNK